MVRAACQDPDEAEAANVLHVLRIAGSDLSITPIVSGSVRARDGFQVLPFEFNDACSTLRA